MSKHLVESEGRRAYRWRRAFQQYVKEGQFTATLVLPHNAHICGVGCHQDFLQQLKGSHLQDMRDINTSPGMI